MESFVVASSVPQVQAIEYAFEHVENSHGGEGDYDTLVHMQRGALTAVILAERLGYDVSDRRILMVGMRVHDAGKLNSDIQALLSIPRPNDEQFKIIQSHAALGLTYGAVLSLGPVVQGITGFHHAYKAKDPYGAELTAVPEDLRNKRLEMVAAVADVCDALLSVREYRENDPSRPLVFTPEEAIEKLRAELTVDADILDAMEALLLSTPSAPAIV